MNFFTFFVSFKTIKARGTLGIISMKLEIIHYLTELITYFEHDMLPTVNVNRLL